jgi:DNA repair protein RecN (Recombination protein N)
MIRRLLLNHFVLVESCDIAFDPHFTAVTGETGAGKTAFTEAIHLCLGQRAEQDLIRKGSDKASVELHLSTTPLAKQLLEEAGFDAEDDEIIIRRELFKEGKSRCFINCRSIPLSFLQTLGKALIDLIGQSTQTELKTKEAQRELLDLFGGVESDLFEKNYRKEIEQRKTLEELTALLKLKEREEELWRFQLSEIEEAHLQEEDEEALFQQYNRLTHAQDVREKTALLTNTLSEGPAALLTQLAKAIKLSETLLSYDTRFSSTHALLQEAGIPLKEALREIDSQVDLLEEDPQALATLEERLSLLSQLKRKYGPSIQDILSHAAEIQKRLSPFETLEEDIENATKALSEIQAESDTLARALSDKRRKAASALSKQLTEQIQLLNMPGAHVDVRVHPAARSSSGDDRVEWWIQANPGENPGPVEEHASGGEMSRLLFALKIVLADKNKTPTLIFDEIDANVGGKTATLIGEKLKELGTYKQVICITHFPQVALHASCHLRVEKRVIDGRTLTAIHELTAPDRDLELARMRGL